MAEMLKETQAEVAILKDLLFKARMEEKPSSSKHTPSVSEQYQKTPRKLANRKILEKGSPVASEVYKEDPEHYRASGMYEYGGTPVWGVPKMKDTKLQLAKFSGRETYKGLGTGVNEWVNRFVRQIERAQMSSGYFWSEEIKMDVLEDHLEGKALEFWQIKRESWCNSTLENAMKALKKNYRCTLSDRQAVALFDKEKPAHRGYTEHLNYLLQVNAAGGGHFDRNVLKSIVHRSGAELIHEISSKYDRSRTDYIEPATELADFADELWNERSINKMSEEPVTTGAL